MDCGPAALTSLFEGFGISASYGRLREACQTDVDGTSIDTLEEVAVQLGLDAEQILIPVDHVLLPAAKALPALAVVLLPSGNTHFVVIWSRHGPFVQLMDPGFGRRWVSQSRFQHDLYAHSMRVPASAWREWAETDEARASFLSRLGQIGVEHDEATRWIDRASREPGWRALATLDAATRAVDAMVRSEGLARGTEAEAVLRRLIERSTTNGPPNSIPKAYWSVWSARHGDDCDPRDKSGARDRQDGEDEPIIARGAVLVRVRGRRSASGATSQRATSLSPELQAVRDEPPPSPGRKLLELLRADGLLAPLSLLAALFLAAAGLLIEALLYRALLDLAPELGVSGQRFGAVAAIVVFASFLVLLEIPIAVSELRFGRRLELRLRAAFQKKIPLLGDRYFHSRLMSDMTERNHSIHHLRMLPPLGSLVVRYFFELSLTVVAISWLAPASAPFAILAGALAVGVPLLAQPLLVERELRVRNHVAGLSRFYLDALLGLVPLRVHGAGPSLRREHEGQLVQWARARLSLQNALVGVEGLQAFLGFGVAVGLVVHHIASEGPTGAVLLLAYWALNLPFLGISLAQLICQYPEHRNVTLRLLEPLGAAEEETGRPQDQDRDETQGELENPHRNAPGVSIAMNGLHVKAGGHVILNDVTLEVKPGEHVAVVGPSGAGKSTLFGVLLGWHRAASGTVLVDEATLQEGRLSKLRRETAWVDPAVQIWNDSLLNNLRYGNDAGSELQLTTVLQQAELLQLLESLPEGHQTVLGEAGGLVSGGEGQRVRLGRAMLRPGVRLVLLDEPFRGLDPRQRARLLERCREFWKTSTLLCVSHDVAETRSFDRVLVMSRGTIVEDGSPKSLAQDERSVYRRMLDAEAEVTALWSSSTWRSVSLQGGTLVER